MPDYKTSVAVIPSRHWLAGRARCFL